MSLLDGMNTLFENKAAMEEANIEMLFDEMITLESDELVDTIVDGKGPFEDDISQMVEEDEANEQLNQELDEEDNSIASASEAALTGAAFLSSLMRDTDDPITTKPGSIGQQDSEASFSGNYSDAANDNNDPIKTKPGSVGQDDSTANHNKNFSDEADDNNDPIKTDAGSVGQKDSTAKDPVMESAISFGKLMGLEDAMESVITQLMPAKEQSRMEADVSTLGINPLDCDKVDKLIADKKYDEAKSVCEAWISEITDSVKDTIDEAKESAAQRLITSTSSLNVAIEAQRMIDREIEKGTDPEIANESVIKRLSSKKDQLKENGSLDTATESAIDIALNWFVANEAGEIGEEFDPNVAMEGLTEKLQQRKDSKLNNDAQNIGLTEFGAEKITKMLQDKQYSKAINLIDKWINITKEISEREEDKSKVKSARHILRYLGAVKVGVETEIELEKKSKEATESLINILANEAGEIGGGDPEATTDGSIGQDSSKAHSAENFSGGALDLNDPVKTKDGAEGQEDSAATFDGNHSGGTLDNNDPIKTDDGSVGQKDSTAKDPASESSTLSALEELEALTQMMNAELEEGD